MASDQHRSEVDALPKAASRPGPSLVGWFVPLFIFLAVLTCHWPALRHPPTPMQSLSVWLEADFLARTSFDYRRLRYEEPVYDAGGERAYMISVVPTMLALLMTTLPSSEAVLVVDHLIGFAFVTLLGTAVFWLCVDRLRMWGAALVVLAVLSFPAIMVQSEIGGMDIKMTSLVTIGLLCLVRGRYRMALGLSVAAFAMKPTALIFTAALASVYGGQLLLSRMRNRGLDRPLAWTCAVGGGILVGEYLAIQWAGTTASLLEDLGQGRSSDTTFHWSELITFIKLSLSTTLAIGLTLTMSLIAWTATARQWFSAPSKFENVGYGRGVVNLTSVGWLTLVGFLLASTVVEVIPRYLVLPQVLASVLLVDAMRKYRRVTCVLFAVWIAANLTQADFWRYPGANDPRIVNVHELHTGYHPALESDQAASRIIERTAAGEPVVASEPYSIMLGRPRLGYVSHQLTGFALTGSLGPEWSDFAAFAQALPREAIYVYTPQHLFGNLITVPLPDPDDEILFDDGLPTPLIVYRKHWPSGPESTRLMEDWVVGWDIPPLLRVSFLLIRNRIDEALEYADREFAGDPAAIETMVNAAGMLLKQGRSEDALALARRALDIDPQSEKGRSMLAGVLFSMGKQEEARTILQEILQEQPDHPDANYLMGIISLLRGEVETASRHFRRCIATQPNHAPALSNLGRLVLMRTNENARGHEERLQEALELFERAVRADPSVSETHFHSGMVLEQLARDRDALEAYQRASHGPEPSVAALERLVWLLAAHPEAAIRDESVALQEARRLATLVGEENARVLDALAVCFAATGEFQAAVQHASRARQMAAQAGDVTLVRELDSRLQVYRSGQRVWLTVQPAKGS